MSDTSLAVVRTYLTAVDADLARTVLEAEGLECVVRTDDCRGLYPNLAWQSAQLLVRGEDAARASRILSEAEAGSPEAGEPVRPGH